MSFRTLFAPARLALCALPLIVAVPAEAKRKPPPPPPAPVIPPAPLVSTAGVTSDVMAGVVRFHGLRPGAPLWLAGNQPSPAGQALLARLRAAQYDGYASGPALAARIDGALLNPAALGEADRLMSGAYVMLLRQLAGPIASVQYADAAARPTVLAPEALLGAIATGGEPALQASLRRSRIFEDLRSAVLADASAHGGVADPRLVANLDRARVIPARGRAVLVNPAAAEVLMIEDGDVVDRMRAVVGTAATPTAPLASMINYVTANPYWNVPEDLVRKIVAPHVVHQGVAYLKRARYEPVDTFGADAKVLPASSIDWRAVLAGTQKVQLRQLPGPYNSMGRIKFGFANDYGIYLHDTPNKPQFAKAARANSNGCVRLEDAPRLARWLLGSAPPIGGTIGDQLIALKTPVPIVIAYLTAQPGAGAMTYAADIYHLDPAAPIPTTPLQAVAVQASIAR